MINFDCDIHPQEDYRGNKPACKYCETEDVWREQIAGEIEAAFNIDQIAAGYSSRRISADRLIAYGECANIARGFK